MNRILVIEDDPDIALSIRYALERDGSNRVSVLHDGQQGLDEALRTEYDLILLDLNLPSIDGHEICRQLRRRPRSATTPIIMITARVDEQDRVSGLDLGADDYITKPFSVKEMAARVRAVLRRSPGDEGRTTALAVGPISLDEPRRRVMLGEEEIALTRREFDLLAELMRRQGRVLTRDMLLERVWGYDHPGATRTVDVHVRQLRKKLGESAARWIETVVGVGYRFRSSL